MLESSAGLKSPSASSKHRFQAINEDITFSGGFGTGTGKRRDGHLKEKCSTVQSENSQERAAKTSDERRSQSNIDSAPRHRHKPLLKDETKINKYHYNIKKVLEQSQNRIQAIKNNYMKMKSLDRQKSPIEDLRSKSLTKIGMGL